MCNTQFLVSYNGCPNFRVSLVDEIGEVEKSPLNICLFRIFIEFTKL